MTTGHRPRKPRRSLFKVIRQEWDASLAFLAFVAFLILAGASDRPLEVESAPFAGAVALGSAVAAAAFVTGRWTDDKLSRDEYGEIIVAIDPDMSRVQWPYRVVTYAGLATAMLGVLLLVTLNEFPRALTVFLYGSLFGLASYSLLGTLSLVHITLRHKAQAAMLRSLKEREAREVRIRKLEERHRASNGNSSG